MEYHNTKNKFPKDQHYAVLVFDTVYIPGDERSRTNPGHGYPASTESVVKYISFKSKDELQEWVGKQRPNAMGEHDFQVIECLPVETVTFTKVMF